MISREFIIRQVGKHAVIGTAIVFFTNLICYGVGILIGQDHQETGITTIITIVLGVVAVVDVIAGYLLKQKFLRPLCEPGCSLTEKQFEQALFKTNIVTSALCASPPIYGLVVVFLGAQTETMISFTIISLAGFLFLRLRPRDFNKCTISE